MRNKLFYIAFLLLAMHFSGSVRAVNITNVEIKAVEPAVGAIRSFTASVLKPSNVEVYEVHWTGDFNNGAFIQGRNYTIGFKLRIKEGSPDIFTTSSVLNVTVNGKKCTITFTGQKNITAKYTWKELGGINPNDPEYKLKMKLKELAAAYPATNATNDKELLAYLKDKLKGAEIWLAGGSYAYTRFLPSKTKDGYVSTTIGIKYNGVTLNRYDFSVVLPATGKSADAANLSADMALMKTALKELTVTSKTKGEDILAALNAAAIHGTKAVWDKNYTYGAPTRQLQGRIDGDIIISLGNNKDIITVHKVLPVAGSAADTAIDADFSALSKALDKYGATNKTTRDELLAIAYSAIKNGSKLKLTSYTKINATYEKEGKVVLNFELENKGKTRIPRIALRIAKTTVTLPAGISVSQDEWEVLRLTNVERYNVGAPCVAMIAPLQDAAHIRSKELVTDFRLDHLRPDGSPCNTAIDPTYINPKDCYENGHYGTVVPSAAVNSWMHSPKHKANLLWEDHCYFGAGVHRYGNIKYWIQIFGVGKDIKSVESSTGSFEFDTIADMKEAYLICHTGRGIKAYVPLDDAYMDKIGNQYTLQLNGKSVTVTVRSNSNR